MKKYLITGINGGLGSYLSYHLSGGEGLHRDNFDELITRYDTIVHCAFNKRNDIDNHYEYLDDNIFLTQRLLDLNYSHFVYISSIDVYNGTNTYSLFKKFAESIVERKHSTIILRCPMLIGPSMKENHLTKMIYEENQKLTLSEESSFNYILYKDILEFLVQEKHKEMDGIYDFVSTNNAKLKDIKKEFDLSVNFGDYVYETLEKFDNPFYTNKTSMETIKEYFK